MKRYYCTYFDRNYLIRALALIESLNKHEKNNFELYAVCMDEITRAILKKLQIPNVTLIPMHEIEQRDFPLLAAKKDRSLIEYYFTSTPTIILRLLERNPEIDVLTYLDADLYFYSSPDPIFEELDKNSVLIHEHRFSPALVHLEIYGKYNVGLLCFRNDDNGSEILKWWREKCIEWCYSRVENGKYADQAYLDDWPERFKQVRVLQNIGVGVAPWNHIQYKIQYDYKNNVITVNELPLIMYHFHSLQFINPNFILPTKYVAYPLTEDILRYIYLPYIIELEKKIELVKSILPDFMFGLESDYPISSYHALLVKQELSSDIENYCLPYKKIELDNKWVGYFSCQYKSELHKVSAKEATLKIKKGQALSETISRINKLISSNKLNDADIAIRRALLDYPDEPEILNLKAVLNMVQGNNEDARLILLDLVEKNDTFVPAYNNLAMISWTSGNFEDATKYFEKALRLSNYERSIVVSYGEMLMAYKKYQEAKEVYGEYLKIAPNDEEIKGLIEKCEGVLNKVKKIGMLIKGGRSDTGIESKFESTEKKELKFVSAEEFLKKNHNGGSFFELVRSKKGDVTHNMYILNDFILASPIGFPISRDGDVIKDKYIYFDIFNKYLGNISFQELFANLPKKKEGKYMAIYGDWAEGFWHWMMENLPVVLLSEEKGFDGYYIIPNTRFARESLELLGVSHERIIEHQGEDFYVETLYIPKKIPGWRLDEFPEVIDKLRNRLLESAGFNDEKTKKRIYISRNKLGSQRRIVINEDALLKLLEEFGFETIYTEEMSLKEQILTMANAEALITPHGSGMVHTLFMPHCSLVIELFAPTYINSCMLSVIKHLRHRYYMVPSYLNKVPPVYDHGWDIEAYLNVIEITMEREIGKSTKVTIKHDEATGSTLKEERISYLKLEDFLKNIKGVPNAHGMIEINDVRGYLVPGDVEYLFNKATELPKNGVIIEIGSFMGLSSIIMASALLSNNNYKAKIYCVDTWEGSPEHKNLDEVKSKQLYEIFLENIQKYKVNSIIYPIRKPSVEAANEFEDLSADFIFIDGDHSFESCYSDLVTWYPKLKEGGILFGHDCVPGSGVSEAVEKFSKEYNINYKIYDFPKTHYMFEIHKPFSDCLSNDKV